MLQKKDLVKQFELVVKQEIIDHNKSINASNLAVNKLSAKLDYINELLSKEILKLRNDQSRLFHDLERNSVTFIQLKDAFQSLRNDQFRLNERNHEEIEVIDQLVETVHRNQQNSDKRIEALEKAILSLKIALKEILKYNETEKERISNKINKALIKLKEEILSIPSEAKKLREEFMQELAMHKIDNEGLLKEIKVLKKTAFINEKKIEDLYMRIESLKKKL